MRLLARIPLYLLLLLSALYFILRSSDYAYLIEGARITYLQGKTSVGIHDYKLQPVRAISAGVGDDWPLHPGYNKTALSNTIEQRLHALDTLAFLVFHNGQLLSEHYFNEGGRDQRSGLWSITKTYASILLYMAVEDGLLENIDDPVSKYLPQWPVQQDPPLTLRHLASMSAGLYWEEFDQRPLALIARMNFTDDITELSLNRLYAIGKPGAVQHYNSGATQLIGTVLNSVLQGEHIADYAARKLWQPLGAEHAALFILDSDNGVEKTFGGMVATARDIARLGQVINNNGYWQQQRILSPELLQAITTLPYNNQTYTYGYWRGEYKGEVFYYQAGHGGQLVLSMPSRNLLISRLGHRATPKHDVEETAPDAAAYIEEALRLIASNAAPQ